MMKTTISIILCIFLFASCAKTKNSNNYDPNSFEAPFNKIAKGMDKEIVLKMCNKPYDIKLNDLQNGEKVDIYKFDTKPKKPIFKIIFSGNKVLKVLRYDGTISLDPNGNAKVD